MPTTPSSTPLGRRAALAAASLTLACLGAGVVQADVAAAAGKANVEASISLAMKQQRLTGKLSSRKRVCRARREVSLQWQPPGQASFEQVRSPATNRRGTWIVAAQQRHIPAGRYFATTAPTRSCEASRSRTITVR